MGGDVPGDDSTDNESAESFQNNGPDGEYQGDVHRDTRDPIEAAADETHDLYDIATWEPRSVLDRFAVGLHTALLSRGRTVLVVMALAIVIAEFALVAVSIADEPVVGLYVFLSVVPAFGIAAYVWRADVTKREPLGNLVVTFLFGFLFAGFAAIVNTVLQGYFQFIPWIGLILFFFIVVAPVEEFVKWLAIRLYAYPSRSFDSVIDGAVYGAIAGLGFATIENSLYIVQRYLETQQMGSPEAGVGAVIGIAALRTFAGPGHVLYAAFSGYYLGLAKFNPGDRGPIIVKGLVIAVGLHAIYNTVVTHLGPILALTGNPTGHGIAFIGFVLVYDGAIAYVLVRKIRRYRAAYRESGAGTPQHKTGTASVDRVSAEGDTPDGGDMDEVDRT